MDGKTSEWRPGPSVCRCCLAEGCYKDISTEYFWMGKKEVYSEMLSETFSVSIAYSSSGGPNSNSRLICESCISRLRDAADFKRQVQECEKTFMQHLDLGGTSTASDHEIQHVPVGKEVKLEQVKVEKRFSDDEFDNVHFADDDDDDDDMDDQPLTKFATKLPKKETVDFLDLIDNSQITVKRKSTTKSKTPPAKKVKVTKKESTKPTASKSAKPIKITTEKKKKDDDAPNTLNCNELTENTARDAKLARHSKREVVLQNAIIFLRHTTVYPLQYINGFFRCFFCDDNFEEPGLYRHHVDSKHDAVDKATIVNLKLVNSQLRVDITDLRCKSCPKIFANLEAVGNHLIEEHQLTVDLKESFGIVPMKLQKDQYMCLICEKKFTGYKSLSMHSGTHFCRIICDVCGKKFENMSTVRSHKLRNHAVACAMCRKTFPSVEARRDHIRTTESCFPFKCTICAQRFLFWEKRQEHLEEVHEEPKKVFPCTECEKIFPKRIHLYLHFKAHHTDDHKCTECDKRFSTTRQLREHMCEHTGLRPLECTVCHKTFTRAKSLKQHLIIHDDSKKIACKVCNKLFVERKKLTLHARKHHPEMLD